MRAARRRAFLVAALAEHLAGDPRAAFPWLTACAERWVGDAFEAAFREAAAAHGVDPAAAAASCGWAVLGLGKLGARELNPSSDVDLVPVYRTDDPEGWPAPVDPQAFHARVARGAATLLSEATADGFCLRVDFDLRPEGRAGTLVNSVDGLLAYYERFGDPLDRMAWTRARPVAGDPAIGAAAVGGMAPFVYPRSVTAGSLPLLSRVLGRLRSSRPAGDAGFDLKTGRGGIRDVELFVAAHQLLHGGRVPGLRDVRTLGVIDALAAAGLVAPPDAAVLRDGYLLLRRLEHALQYREDRQTHALPPGPAGLEALASLLPGADAGALAAALAASREAVARLADRLFGLPAGGEAGDPVATVLDAGATAAAREAAARGLGFLEPEALLSRLGRLRDAPSSPLHPRNEGRYPGLDAAMVRAAAGTAWPDGAMDLLSRLARDRRSRPLCDLCAADGRVLAGLARAGGDGPAAAAALGRDPALALEHALSGFAGALPGPGAALAAVQAAAAGDPDEAGERIAAARQELVVGVALADLAGRADEGRVGQALSDVADASIEVALELAGIASDVAVVGLGRLGGRELGYRSDLDLVFLHREGADVAAPVRRVLTLLTTRGADGPMYELDLRLRPSGGQGPLLVPAGAFVAWHAREAGAAESLGVLNARRVAGSAEVGDPAVAVAREAAFARVRTPEAVRAVLEVRDRQRAAAGTPARGFQPKLAPGGLLDVETAARLAGVRVLASAADVPTGTLALLDRLAGLPAPLGPEAARLGRVARFLVRLVDRAWLALDRPPAKVPEAGPSADRLARAMGFEGQSRAEALGAACAATLDAGRKGCERMIAIVAAGGPPASSTSSPPPSGTSTT